MDTLAAIILPWVVVWLIITNVVMVSGLHLPEAAGVALAATLVIAVFWYGFPVFLNFPYMR